MNPAPRAVSRVRGLLAAGVSVIVVALWAAAVLMAREILPGAPKQVDRLFAGALAATYLGAWVVAVTLAPGRRLMFLRAMGATVTLILMIALLELPAAFRWIHWSLVFRGLSGEGAQDYTNSYVLDPVLGFRRIPNRQWTARPRSDLEEGTGLPRAMKRGITFTYDRWGYRNPADWDRADIVMLGDSFVEGWYVSDHETTAAVLGRRLGLRVANLGVAGYGTLQALRVLESEAIRRSPRIVIWYFFEGNDLYDDQAFENAMLAAPPSEVERTAQPGGLTRFHGWARRSFVRNGLRRLRMLLHPIVPSLPPYRANLVLPDGRPLPIYFGPDSLPWTDYEDERWATAAKTFVTGIEVARQRGAKVLLVFVPFKFRVFQGFLADRDNPIGEWRIWEEYPAKFTEFCRAAEVPCLDVTPALRETLRRGALVYPPTDTHWNAEGHAVVAGELASHLKRLGWVP